MDYNLLNYYLGNLSTSATLSAQCLKVSNLLLTDQGSDSDRLLRVLDYLDGSRPINDDTVQWLKRGIRGHYGGEGNVLDVSAEEESVFWDKLHIQYPQNAWLCFVAADAIYFLDKPESLRLFFRAFELDSSLIHELEGEVWDAIQDSEYRLQYDLLQLADAKHAGDERDYQELRDELLEKWSEDAEALKSISSLAGNA